jgi:hypothetical protein
VLVARDGITDWIDRTPSVDDQEGDAPDRRTEGLQAHRLVWDYFNGRAA